MNHRRTEAGPQDLVTGFARVGYVLDLDLATSLFLLRELGRPLLLEGHAGVGKTEVAIALAAHAGSELIRLQCYEGLDVQQTVYEWNYTKQLLATQVQRLGGSSEGGPGHLFTREFLLERPLLRAISEPDRAPVLLIDEVDRADEEFEAFLLELLSANQITIPELGTIRAIHPPHVILTSNRTRELSDALKRRCLYHWIDYPDAARELAIVRERLPQVTAVLARQVVLFIQELRQMRLQKTPGVAETLDWAAALMALGAPELERDQVRRTLGCFLKTAEDQAALEPEQLGELLDRARARSQVP